MNSFSRQGKALPVEVRNIIVGKWLHNEGIASIANIIQYLIQYFSWVLQYLIHQHANFAFQVLTQYSKFGNEIRNIQNKLGKRALKSDLKSTVKSRGISAVDADRITKLNETYLEVEVWLEFYQPSTEQRLHALPLFHHLPAYGVICTFTGFSCGHLLL